MSQAVIYCRVSTKEQTENLSLQTQQKACADYCQRLGFHVDRVFVEEGESAKTAERPELQRLLAYCRENKGRIQLLVVYNLSRFARSKYDHVVLMAHFNKLGISLRSVTEPIDETSTGKLMEGVLAAFAQFDNDVRAERTVTGMKAAIEAGRWTFQAPLGYVNVVGRNSTPNISPDPERAHLVRKAFETYVTGLYSKKHVLQIITNEGLRTRRGKKLSPQTFNKLLCNPFYAGWISIPKWGERRAGRFEPLVSENLFDKVQAILAGRKPIVTPYLRNNPDFPLRRSVSCGFCGKPLTGSWSTGRKERYAYYSCYNKECRRINVRKTDLETGFARYLERLQPRPEYARLFNEIVLETWKEKQAESQAQRKAHDRKLEELRKRKDLLVEAFIYRREIDKGTYQDQLDKLNEKITLAEMDAHNSRLEELDVEAVLGFSEHILLNAARLWMELELEQKQRLQRVLFPRGIQFFDGEFKTGSICFLFKVLQEAEDKKAIMASPTGFEPVLPA